MFRSKKGKLLNNLWKHRADECDGKCKHGNKDDEHKLLSTSNQFNNGGNCVTPNSPAKTATTWTTINPTSNNNNTACTVQRARLPPINCLSRSLSTLNDCSNSERNQNAAVEHLTKLMLSRLKLKDLENLLSIIKDKGRLISSCIIVHPSSDDNDDEHHHHQQEQHPQSSSSPPPSSSSSSTSTCSTSFSLASFLSTAANHMQSSSSSPSSIRLPFTSTESLLSSSSSSLTSSALNAPQSPSYNDYCKMWPHVLACKVWRWPHLNLNEVILKTCTFACKTNASDICINPYHWSQVERTDEISSTAVYLTSKRRAPSSSTASIIRPLSSVTDNRKWAEISYWEHREHVGRSFSVERESIDIFADSPRGNGLCLASILNTGSTTTTAANYNNNNINMESNKDALSVKSSAHELERSSKIKKLIGLGIRISQESDGVWIYNRSNYPIFLNSITLDKPDTDKLTVRKLLPGYSINAFDYEKANEYRPIIENNRKNVGPPGLDSIRISFVKGWGANYSRMYLLSCPCWLEVWLPEI